MQTRTPKSNERKRIAARGLNADEWLIVKSESSQLVIVGKNEKDKENPDNQFIIPRC